MERKHRMRPNLCFMKIACIMISRSDALSVRPTIIIVSLTGTLEKDQQPWTLFSFIIILWKIKLNHKRHFRRVDERLWLRTDSHVSRVDRRRIPARWQRPTSLFVCQHSKRLITNNCALSLLSTYVFGYMTIDGAQVPLEGAVNWCSSTGDLLFIS